MVDFRQAFSDFLIAHLDNIVFILLIVALTYLVLRFVGAIYSWLSKKIVEPYDLPISEGGIKFVIYLFAGILVITALPSAGDNIIPILGIAAGIIIAFSSTTLISNGMAGLMIKIIKPYKEGDMMEVKGRFGKVYHIGIFHTTLQTLHGEIVIVPSLIAISDLVINYTQGNYVINVKTNLGYDLSRSEAEKLLLTAVERTKNVKQGYVLITELGSFGVDYEVNGIISDVEKKIQTESDLRKHIFDVFYENDVQIMTPTYMVTKQLYRDEQVLPTEHKRGPRRGIQNVEKVVFGKAREEVEKKAQEDRERSKSTKKNPKKDL